MGRRQDKPASQAKVEIISEITPMSDQKEEGAEAEAPNQRVSTPIYVPRHQPDPDDEYEY